MTTKQQSHPFAQQVADAAHLIDRMIRTGNLPDADQLERLQLRMQYDAAFAGVVQSTFELAYAPQLGLKWTNFMEPSQDCWADPTLDEMARGLEEIDTHVQGCAHCRFVLAIHRSAHQRTSMLQTLAAFGVEITQAFGTAVDQTGRVATEVVKTAKKRLIDIAAHVADASGRVVSVIAHRATPQMLGNHRRRADQDTDEYVIKEDPAKGEIRYSVDTAKGQLVVKMAEPMPNDRLLMFVGSGPAISGERRQEGDVLQFVFPEIPEESEFVFESRILENGYEHLSSVLSSKSTPEQSIEAASLLLRVGSEAALKQLIKLKDADLGAARAIKAAIEQADPSVIEMLRKTENGSTLLNAIERRVKEQDERS
ncbi:MAG TPA: hypothetical protein VG722_09540 [Tepidisphaeraceae bacterium]|nr:hypothetical protein [Tepidisphaeraceae bacterium]